MMAYETKDKGYAKREDRQIIGFGGRRGRGTPTFHEAEGGVEGMAGSGNGAEAVAQGAEAAGDAECGCRCAGVVSKPGAGLPMGDQPGAAEGDGGGRKGSGESEFVKTGWGLSRHFYSYFICQKIFFSVTDCEPGDSAGGVSKWL